MTKILLVEDDKSLREIYGVRLLAEGYDIVSAGDGEEALAMAIKERPQLIVSDVMMPKISGFDMLDILRSTTETRDIKVIMMTALSSDDQRARGEQLGADRYLVKSQVGIEDVVRTVHEVLGDSGSTTQAAEPQAAPVPQQSIADSSVNTTADETTLPQPTAPFASPRPATLGERVINPIESTLPDGATVQSQIEQELQASQAPAQPAPAAAQPVDTFAGEPVAAPVAQPASEPVQQYQQDDTAASITAPAGDTQQQQPQQQPTQPTPTPPPVPPTTPPAV